MRITLRIDDDLLCELRRRADAQKVMLTKLVNELLRLGLASKPAVYREKVHSMGTASVDLDKALSIASTLEDEEVIRKIATLDAETRSRLLERMLDEELLLQRGVELGLHRFEPTARRAIVAALIASVTADAEAIEPDLERLRDFYAENMGLFKRPGRISLDAAFVSTEVRPDAQAHRMAQEIARRLRVGDPFDEVQTTLADLPVAKLPRGPLSIETVRQYLGPTLAQVANRLAVAEVSDPTRGSSGYFVLRLRDRDPGEVAKFDVILEQVRAEYLRRQGEAGLRDYLAGLREAAEIRVLDADQDS